MSLIKIDKEKFIVEFGIQKLPKREQEKIWQLVSDIFQTKILDHILSQLEEEEKEQFLNVLLENEEESEKLINRKLPDIEKQLDKVINDTKKELISQFKSNKV